MLAITGVKGVGLSEFAKNGKFVTIFFQIMLNEMLNISEKSNKKANKNKKK